MHVVDPLTGELLRDRVARTHRETYGEPPAAVGFAPGRVNLIGEHVDYNGGACLPIALPHGTCAAVDRRGGVLRVTSGDRTSEVPVDLPGRGEWSDYVAGVLWAAEVPGAWVTIDSTVPIGAGLSSSAALECAVGAALGLEGDALAEAGVRAESRYVGAPTGGLDQAVAVHGLAGHALLLDFDSGERRQVPFDLAAAGLALLVVDTRVSHALSEGDGGYATRRAECERAAEALGVDLLARADSWEGLGDPVLTARARHVITETARTHAVVAALETGDWERVGELFTASHASLRDDFEVSCPELDAVVATALEHGALGARMTGGGFGGSAIALVRADAVDEVGAAVDAAFAAQGWAAPSHLLARAEDGARRLA